MKLEMRVFISFLAAAGLLLAAVPDLGAQGGPTLIGKYQYAAKFVCGTNWQDKDRVVGGQYATAVNIHNPGTKNVTFRKKIALTYPPQEQRPGEISEFITDKLGPDEALAVDCEEILKEFVFPNPPPPTSYLKGFLVIESKRSLDVTAVYTAGEVDAAGVPSVQTIDVEEIKERRIQPQAQPGG